MATIYKIKENIDLSKLEEIGYTLFEDTFTAVKVVKQPLEGAATQYLLNSYYENPKWIKSIYKPSKKRLKKELGLEYSKENKLIFNEKLIEMLTTWFIQIDKSEDKWVGFTSGDKFDTNVFYGKKVLDTYCSEEIKLLKENDLIEELYVEE